MNPEENNTTSSTTDEDSVTEVASDAFLRGTVTRVTYHNDESGFGVIRVEPDSDVELAFSLPGNIATLVGVMPGSIASGSNIIARGMWTTHPKFGKQFKARSVSETIPTTSEAITKYLGSGIIKGFGPVLAARVVEAFGDDALSIIDKDPDRLREIPGIGEIKLIEIKDAWLEKQNLREVLLFFQNHGVSLKLAQRIYNSYRNRAIEIVSENPYLLARDVRGIGFQTADKIAQALGLDPRAPARIVAGLSYALKSGSDDGHCFLPKEILIGKTLSLLALDDEELISDGLETTVRSGDIIQENNAYYLPSLYLAEDKLAESIAERISSFSVPAKDIDERYLKSICERTIATPGGAQGASAIIALSEQQKETIHLAAEKQLIVITGGPGCGKTTVVKAIAGLFRGAGLQVKLAAPTGRASQRLSEVCGMEASTIHRLLKFDPMKRSFVHDEHDTLALDAIIIDECSMVDIPLAASLLSAIPKGARIVIVGDSDQLPSVGPGLFLADLLRMKEVPRVSLTKLFRRADESAITHIAHKINASVVPKIPEPDGTTKTDAYFLTASDVTDAANLIEKVVVEQIPKKFGFKGSEMMVLSPMNQGDLGVHALNERLQARLIPEGGGVPSVRYAGTRFSLGDRVVQRVNNYNIHTSGVFNGDQGEIIGIDAEAQSMTVRFWDGRQVEYPSDTFYQLSLAYALTIHRSQGSEMPVIVLALHDSHNILLERQLLYTAVTRAKKLLIIVGSKRALAIATKRTRSKRRYTRLTEKTLAELATGEDLF